jgi:hypothetical protein
MAVKAVLFDFDLESFFRSESSSNMLTGNLHKNRSAAPQFPYSGMR